MGWVTKDVTQQSLVGHIKESLVMEQIIKKLEKNMQYFH